MTRWGDGGGDQRRAEPDNVQTAGRLRRNCPLELNLICIFNLFLPCLVNFVCAGARR